ncbi:MAG TPA: flagellar hook-associated protein FlgK [Pseudolabrys sp.]
MSINSAAYIAISGMMATQVQMEVASANISNADTVGYTEKTAQQVSVVTGGMGAGTAISDITGSVDKALMSSLVGATSDLGAANATNNYLGQLESLFGSVSGTDSTGTSLGNTLASLESAVSTLEGTPNSASLQANVVGSLNDALSQLQDTSSGIQDLRGNANQDIATSVDDVNTQLQLIGSLNIQIQQATATNQPTGDLEDQRNTALQDVASNLDVSYFTTSSGSLQVYTSSGQALVDTSVHQLSYTPAANVTASTTYSATPPSGFGGIMVNGVDITSQIQSGSIGALIDLRDTSLPDAQSQLDQLANQLKASVNAVNNQGTSIPPPTSLTGTAAVSSTTPLAGSGTVRIAVADQSGNLVSYQDLNLSSYATVGDLVSAINGISGVSASINSTGNVVIASTDTSDGIAINEMSSAVGANGQGLSDWLGLNDLITGSGASDIAVRSDVLNNPSLLATSTLDSSASPATGSQVLSPGSTTAVDDLYQTLIGSTSFSTAGGLGSTSTSFADYAANIVGDVASKSSQASSDYTNKQTAQSYFSDTMSSESGVNLDQETARLSSLQNQYTASAELLQVLNQMFTSLMTAVQSAAT